ncbi:MAG: hypothetical protein ACJZ8K_02960 [Paracoccaceae bacterium]
MSGINLTPKYLFNEIPGDQKKIDEFGHKACKLSLAKKWQFSLPDTVFLSGDLVKEIFEKKKVPAEILSHFKNKLLAIRPSPVIGQFTKNEPFIYIGLDDQNYDSLKQRVGVEKASETYLNFLRMFAVSIYNLDLENCDELRRLLENLKRPQTISGESSTNRISRIKQLISLEIGSNFPRDISEQLIHVINSIYKSWISPSQQILRKVSGRKSDELIPVILQEMHSGIIEKPVEYFKVKNFDDKTGKSNYMCFRLERSNDKPSFNPVGEEEVSEVLKLKSLHNLIRSLTKKVKSPLEVNFLLDGDTLFLIDLKEVALAQKKFIEFVVSSVSRKDN